MLALLFAGGVWWWLCRWRATADPEGAFYLWILVSLVIVPHMERYNHALLLPALAWLWRQGSKGQEIAIVVYFLVGLARLTHLWAILLPAPWGPLATGFGLYATLLLAGGLLTFLRPSPSPNP